ncbi:carboxymuconolactone decarboxylase family protein [Streptomyces fulvoviolaceus]|uniref:carboxymuconolactone decarboxylase family protein n=1 Tax=Streptomyces fulvoviolaceus TaxID=285535 RepID=UPI0004C6822A|nr:carboxymuconolactone decarboxylase family protein [Streptomyces fulvoviolaceus]MCT9075482.1 carboxymuconolactone decarboxylase family protein [Streptomyces fulvoviolaceus]
MNTRTTKGTSVRRLEGEQVVREMLGEGFLRESMAGPADGAPGAGADLARLALEQCYGDIWTRPGLDRRSRSLITLGILMAQGHQAELRNHVVGALGNGLSPEEILEATVHAVPYIGLPAAGHALATAADTLRGR